MSDPIAHIAGWEAAGLIDRETADRLRAAEAAAHESLVAGPTNAGPAAHPRSAVAAMFGPGVTIAEVFGFLGGGFLLAAWTSFISHANGPTGRPEMLAGVMALVAAAALAGLGLRLRGVNERASRAAGVAFILTSSYVGAGAIIFANTVGLEFPAAAVVASGAALATGVVLRAVHRAVLTQVGVLTWATALAGSTLAWLQVTLFPDPVPETVLATPSGPNPIILVLASAAWWLATAVIIALIGLREARTAERDADPAAARRAAVSRFWAGLLAVIGLTLAIVRTADLGNDGFGRVLDPWIGDLALLALAAVLVERAFRRDASSFIYAAALGLIVALTDFNVSYLSGSNEVALIIEGLILLGVGLAADRLRRRVGHDGVEPPAEATELVGVGDPA